MERAFVPPAAGPAEPLIAHVDMDAFFVSCELLRRPQLRGKPVVVGGSGGRGVVMAASYEARKFGVHSALPMAVAKRRCPDAIVVPRDIDLYRRGSRAVMEVLRSFSDLVEVLGMDEAYLDISGCPTPRARGRQIKRAVFERTRLVCSVGIGPNRLIAKIASDLDKPDGLCVLSRERFLDAVGDRPARIIPGVGPKTDERLEEIGIRTVGELARTAPGELARRLGPKHAAGLVRRAQGYGSAELASSRERKSESRERTFEHDLDDPAEMREAIDSMARGVAEHLAEQGIRGRTVTVKIRLRPFRTFTRSKTLAEPSDDPALIARTARELFAAFERDAPVRLLGVGVSSLDRGQADGPAGDAREGPDAAAGPQLQLV